MPSRSMYLVLCNLSFFDDDGVVSPPVMEHLWVLADDKQHAARNAAIWIEEHKPNHVNKRINHVLSVLDWGSAGYFPVIDMPKSAFDSQLAAAQDKMSANAAIPRYPRSSNG